MSARSEAKEETREALVSAAIALIAEQGVDRPSLDAICARAGFTRGAFYVHFQDRDELLVAVLDRVGRAFLDGVLGDGTHGLEAMSADFVTAIADGRYPLMGPGSVRPTQLLDACSRSPRIRRRYVALVEETIARVAVAAKIDRAEGKLPDDAPPEVLGALMLALVIGAQTMLDLGVPLDLGRGAALVRSLLRGERAAEEKKPKKKRSKRKARATS